MKTQLKTLLSSHPNDSFLLAFLNVFNDERSTFDTTRPIPIKEVKDIYRARACLNQRRGNPIAGFEELLNGLEAFGEEPIRIHWFAKSGQMCAIFTDASVEKLVGVLFKAGTEAEPELEKFAASAAS